MEVNLEAVKKLIKEKFRNNQTYFAEELGLDRHYLNQILHGKAIAHSPKTIRAIIDYCKRKNIDYTSYIVF